MRRIIIFAVIASIILLGIFMIFSLVRSRRFFSAQESASVSGLLGQAKEFELKGDLVGVKEALRKLISEFPNSGEVMGWQKKLEELNIKLIFSPVVTSHSILYQIKPGDSIVKIAQGHNTTPELIMKSNHLTSEKIIPGKKIKVWNASFSIVVDKSQNILILKVNEEVFKVYTVSTGANNSTPVGIFKIVNKIPNPTWFKAGAVVSPDSPENILGSRWLGFNLSGY
ncbi:MAG: LysM peptidoglycan-binding domain-containing protein, partial [Candidatus Omnitrophica bacterium]|nr:LysM peptidoglycan-binding domain-containing protein [Candidatus Omnitrophota bacterium]